MSVETFTIREAAAHCGVTYQLMRKRVDRGTLRTVKRDGVRRIPRSELERAGLWPRDDLQLSASVELMTLRQRLAVAEAKVAELSPLPAQLSAERDAHERTQLALHEQRAAAMVAERQRAEEEARRQRVEADAERDRQAAAAALAPLTAGGLISSVRALLSLRRVGTDDQHRAEREALLVN